MTRRANPINYERLSPGMRDKTTQTDQGMPYPRLIQNIDCDTNSLKRRRGLRLYADVGTRKGDILRLVQGADGLTTFAFCEGGIWQINHGASYGSYSDKYSYASSESEVHTAKYKRIADEAFTDYYATWASNTTRSFTVDPSYADMTPGEHSGKIARFNLYDSTDYEYFQISTNSVNTLYIEGVFNTTYEHMSQVRVYETEPCLLFTSNSDIKSVTRSDAVVEHSVSADIIATYSGRLFKYIKGTSKLLFSDLGTMNFSNDQYITIEEDAGNIIQIVNYFDSLVLICERALYTIRGAFPEEFIPQRRMTENIRFTSWKGADVVNGVMYVMTNKGLYSFNRLETQASPEARPISYFLDQKRFDDANIKDKVTAIWGNRVLCSMQDKPDSSGAYILVYDADLSILFGEAWFAEYDGFLMDDLLETEEYTFIADRRYLYTFEEDQDQDELIPGVYVDIIATLETNAIEYGPRGTEKRWRDFKTYMTEYENSGSIDLYQKLYVKGRDLDWTTISEWLRDPAYEDEHYSLGIFSPYLFIKLEMKGHFVLEDMELLLFPTGLYGKAGKSR